MRVGPTRGLAERPRPFFRHTLLEWGEGEGWPGWLPSCPPAPSPPGEVIAPAPSHPVKWLSGIASALVVIGFHV